MSKNSNQPFFPIRSQSQFATSMCFPRIDVKASMENKYGKPYLRFKSQSTVLSALEVMVEENMKNSNKNDTQRLEYLYFLIQSLKMVPYGHIFETASNTINAVRSLLSSSEHSIVLEKPALMLLRVSLSILHASNILVAQKADSGPLLDFSIPYVGGEDTVVCRICEEPVKCDLIEEHTKSCLQAYRSDHTMKVVDGKITEAIQKLKGTKLIPKWPGNKQEVILSVFPYLHASIILERSLSVCPLDSDASDELRHLTMSLSKIFEDKVMMLEFNDMIALLREKTKIASAMANATSVLRQTRVSGSPQPPSMNNLTIADFDFIKRVSSGAFARVFIARKKATGDVYAIKALPKSSLKQKNQSKRIMAERDILLQFNNPYIVTLYYSVIGTRNLYLVNEYVPGGDLYSLLQRFSSFDEESSKIYVYEILLALKYLRENGIIHRDIKPDNILIQEDGTLKLTDFGLSYLGFVDRQAGSQIVEKTNDETLSAASSFVGTPDYMAPEIILNQPHSFTVDYWSLGIMLYEFLYGVTPFNVDNGMDIQTNILKGNVVFYEDTEISTECKSIILALLQPDQHRRLGSKDIMEIFNHSWFNGFDIDTAQQPYIPQIKSVTDTQNFEERYRFNNQNDNDILLDIEEASQPSDFVLDTEEDNDDMNNFTQVAIDKLSETNFKAKETVIHQRSKSFASVQKISMEENDCSDSHLIDTPGDQPFNETPKKRKYSFTQTHKNSLL